MTGRTARTLRLRVTASAPATANITIAKRRRGRWITLPGSRAVRLPAGRTTRVLRPSSARTRLTPGSYRVVLRVGTRVVRASFSVR